MTESPSAPLSPSSTSLASSDEENDAVSDLASPVSGSDELALNRIVNLNVGGKRYTTTMLTLTKRPGTVLAKMFSTNYREPTKNEEGDYFIDADGELFGYVLRYLQHDILPPRDKVREVYQVADFFCVDDMTQRLELLPEVALHQIQGNVLTNEHLNQVDEHVRDILEKAKELSKAMLRMDAIRMEVCIRNKWSVKHMPPERNHRCARLLHNVDDDDQCWIAIPADVVMNTTRTDMSESDYRNGVMNRMADLGYTLRHIDDTDDPAKHPYCIDSLAKSSRSRGCGGRLFTMALVWMAS